MAIDNHFKTVVLQDAQTKKTVNLASVVKMEGAGYHGFQDTVYNGTNKLLINEGVQTTLSFNNVNFKKEFLPQIGTTSYPLYDFDNQLILSYPEFKNSLCRIRLQFVAENSTAAAGQGVRVSLYSPSGGFSLDRNTVALLKGADEPQRVRELFTFYADEVTDQGLEIRITPVNGDIKVYNANLLISSNM